MSVCVCCLRGNLRFHFCSALIRMDGNVYSFPYQTGFLQKRNMMITKMMILCLDLLNVFSCHYVSSQTADKRIHPPSYYLDVTGPEMGLVLLVNGSANDYFYNLFNSIGFSVSIVCLCKTDLVQLNSGLRIISKSWLMVMKWVSNILNSIFHVFKLLSSTFYLNRF